MNPISPMIGGRSGWDSALGSPAEVEGEAGTPSRLFDSELDITTPDRAAQVCSPLQCLRLANVVTHRIRACPGLLCFQRNVAEDSGIKSVTPNGRVKVETRASEKSDRIE
jgi:hypothetical protein